MVAARVSKVLNSVDIDPPGAGNNEVVKALANQIIAYSLRNMEHFMANDGMKAYDPAAVVPELEIGRAHV